MGKWYSLYKVDDDGENLNITPDAPINADVIIGPTKITTDSFNYRFKTASVIKDEFGLLGGIKELNSLVEPMGQETLSPKPYSVGTAAALAGWAEGILSTLEGDLSYDRVAKAKKVLKEAIQYWKDNTK